MWGIAPFTANHSCRHGVGCLLCCAFDSSVQRFCMRPNAGQPGWHNPDPPDCGPASPGNLTCSGQEDPCCSRWGHCGRTDLHCAAATCLPRYGSCNLPSGPATIVTTQNEHRLCGYSPSSGNITDIRCPDSACCIIYGWCGYGDRYCKLAVPPVPLKDVKQAMATVQKCVMPTPGSVVLEVLLLVFLQCYHLLSQLWLQ